MERQKYSVKIKTPSNALTCFIHFLCMHVKAGHLQQIYSSESKQWKFAVSGDAVHIYI